MPLSRRLILIIIQFFNLSRRKVTSSIYACQSPKRVNFHKGFNFQHLKFHEFCADCM